MTLGERLRARRESFKWTQARVAQEVSLLRSDGRRFSQQALHQLEKRGSTKSEFVHELAAVLKTNVSWLLTGEGDPDRVDQVGEISDYARYVAENFDRLPPIRQEMVREIFANWGREVARAQEEEQTSTRTSADGRGKKHVKRETEL